ncbi:hypothetical protein N018_21890 [Pseudomonas syringae CC1557]|uniref:Uncharacterized protein n=1 Tax=Pseudomonas syringae CC1557 TaxID=1357279 RepID=W0MYL1_PSESX|nr:hypothetical protein N018_21890 [Pseudomonas syringae CC1557]
MGEINLMIATASGGFRFKGFLLFQVGPLGMPWMLTPRQMTRQRSA